MASLLEYINSVAGSRNAPKSFKSLSKPGMEGKPQGVKMQPIISPAPQAAPAPMGISPGIQDMLAGWAQGGNDWQRSLGLGAASMLQGRRERQQMAQQQAEREWERQQQQQQLQAARQSAIAAGIDPEVASGLDGGSLRQLIAADYSNDRQDAQFTRQQAAEDGRYKRTRSDQLSDYSRERVAKIQDEKRATEARTKAEQEARTLAIQLGVPSEVALRAPIDVVNDTLKGAFKDKNAGPNIDDELKIRKDFENQPGVKRYREVAPMLNSMAASLKDPSAVSDLDFIYGVAKILDPASVVREGEMVLVQNTNNLPDYVTGALQKALKGESALTAALRQNLFNLAQRRGKSLYDQAQSEYENYSGLASQYKMDPARVVRPLDPFQLREVQGPSPKVDFVFDPDTGELRNPVTGETYQP